MKAFAFVAALSLAACSDQPAREKFPGPQGRTTDTNSAEMTQAMLGGFDPLNNAFQQQQATAPKGEAPAKAEGGGGAVEGTISLAAGKAAKPGTWLFISVRSKMGGPPLAAKREANAQFPYKFRLSQADAMMAETVFEGEVDVTARIDQDGDPLSRQEGDLAATVSVKIPASGLKLELK